MMMPFIPFAPIDGFWLVWLPGYNMSLLVLPVVYGCAGAEEQ